MSERIAKITGTFLGREDHGILTAYLYLSYGGSGQSVGGYFFDESDPTRKGHRRGLAQAADFIAAVIACCNVDSWEQVPGRTVHVLFDSDEWNAQPAGMAPLPTESGRSFRFAEVIPSPSEAS